jgi:hypothetical protein
MTPGRLGAHIYGKDFRMTTKYADDPATENARKVLAEETKATEKSRADFASRTKGKPTPTQEELNMTALGAHILEHEEDGSDPDLNVQTRQMEASSSSARPYSTRQQHAKSE